MNALRENQIIVVESPTGSGKTTQIPLILFEEGLCESGVLGVTQPRRIAAVSVCDFIGRQLADSPEGTVGYTIRFEDKTTPNTKIKIMTDGILLQELKHDPNLLAYSIIMIDEAHERSLNIDFILGLLKQIAEKRKDLKIIISSATINAEVFSEYFGECPIVRIESEVFPVEILYTPPPLKDNYEELIRKISDLTEKHSRDPEPGDILVFLPGEKAIKDTILALQSLPCSSKLQLLPLYGRLGKEEQEKVFPPAPKGKIKVIVATNIAETSITIDGVTLVIDSGLGKLNHYSPKTFTESLIETPVSKASCNQRKGRAGRTRPGICYRLYEKEDFDSRPLFTLEEIYRTDLSEVVLRMSELGIRDFESFDFISPPGAEGIRGAVRSLKILKALKEDNSLSDIGKMMAEFPLIPRLSRMIIEAVIKYPRVIRETITASSFLSTSSPFLLPPGQEMEARNAHHSFSDPGGDFVSYLKILAAFRRAQDKERFCRINYLDIKTLYEIDNITVQLEEIVSSLGIPVLDGGETDDYIRAVSGGLLQYVCQRQSFGIYRSPTAQRIYIHPGSLLFRESPKYIVAGEIVKTSRMYARTVSPLKRQWIQQISPWLADHLIEGKTGEEDKTERDKKKRDTTWVFKFCGQSFELKQGKGRKKIAVLPWETLAQALKKYNPREGKRFKTLRAVITFQGEEIISGIKLPKAVDLARNLFSGKESIYLDFTFQEKNYQVPEDVKDLIDLVPNIMKLSRPQKEKGGLGFLCLETNGKGRFWFRLRRNVFQALSANIAGLDSLGSSLGGDHSALKGIGRLYRKLTELIDV